MAVEDFQKTSKAGLKIEIVSADELEAIHLASLEILERIGVAVQSERARQLCKRAGCGIGATFHALRDSAGSASLGVYCCQSSSFPWQNRTARLRFS